MVVERTTAHLPEPLVPDSRFVDARDRLREFQRAFH